MIEHAWCKILTLIEKLRLTGTAAYEIASLHCFMATMLGPIRRTYIDLLKLPLYLLVKSAYAR